MFNSGVSIVIPAYNAECGVEVSARSVLAQTLKEMEVWIVDDGARDRTGEIADNIVRTDSRVYVIHQKNKGAYIARLNALRHIRTPFFGFVDSDDKVEPTMYEKMLKFAEDETLDIVQCRQFGEVTVANTILEGREDVTEQVILPWLWKGIGACFIWDKLYRNIYDFSRFDNAPITMFDDMIFNLQFFLPVRRMGFWNEGLYHYQVNDSSSVRNYRPKNLNDFLYTVNFRFRMANTYGLEDNQDVLNAWILLNARNLVMIASSASGYTLKERTLNVKKILAAKEIIHAMTSIHTKTMAYKLLFVVSHFPLISVFALNRMKYIQRLLKK